MVSQGQGSLAHSLIHSLTHSLTHSHLGQWMFRRGRGSTSADEVASKVASPSRQTVHRALLVHVAWALIFTGWAPFVWQAMSGTWDDSRLGCWPNWAPLGALGGVLMHETAPLRHFRPACKVMGMGSCIVSAAILTYYPHVSSSRIDRGTALAHQADSDPLDAWDEGVDRWLQTHNLHNSAPALSLDSAALRFALYCFWFASAGLCTPRLPCTPHLCARACACACAGPNSATHECNL